MCGGGGGGGRGLQGVFFSSVFCVHSAYSDVSVFVQYVITFLVYNSLFFFVVVFFSVC